MLFFSVKFHFQFQYYIYLKNPFFPICIGFYFQILIDHSCLYIGDHICSTAVTFHLAGERYRVFCPLKRIVFIIACIHNKKKQFPSCFNHIFFRSQIQSPDFCRIPEQFCHIRLIGHQWDFFPQTQSVFFMYTETHQVHFLFLHRYRRIFQIFRKSYSAEFIYHCIKSNHCLNIHFSGMDQMNAQIFNFPFQLYFISINNSIKIQGFFHGKNRCKTTNPAICIFYIKKICFQTSSDISMTIAEAKFFYSDFSFVLDHPSNVRFGIGHIIIQVKSYLAGCFAFGP